MSMSRQALEEKLLEAVSGRLSLDVFEDWLVAGSWNIHLSSAPRELQELVWAIDHDFAQCKSDDAALRLALEARLAELLSVKTVPPRTSCTASLGSFRSLVHMVSGTAPAALESPLPEAAS